ncbi:MAG: vitamin K epoxide reductase family protein [Pirellulales bacterium]
MRLPSEIEADRRGDAGAFGSVGEFAGVGAVCCSLATRALLALLAATALGFSAYLAWLSLSGGTVAGCNGEGAFDCDHVLTTRWSTWLGVPIALPAAMIYGSVLATVWFLGPSVPTTVRRVAWTVVLTFTAAAALAATWFIGLQALVIGHLCWPCLATHGSGLLLAAAAWAAVFIAARRVGTPLGGSAFVAGGIALAATGVLVGGQLAYEPPTFRIDRGESPRVADANKSSVADAAAKSSTDPQPNGSAGASSERTAQKPPLSRILHLHKMTTTLDAYEHPILGSPDAEHVIVKLFDYTCHHCRDQHFQLEEARRHFGDRLAIVVLPTPMNRACNAFVSDSGSGPRAQACVYALLAVAVWQTDRTKFEAFHHWLFEPETPRPIDDVRARVREIVGQAGIDRADNSLEPRQAIEKYTNLYGSLGKGNIPKLVDANFVIDGRFRDAQQLVEVLEEEWKPAQ